MRNVPCCRDPSVDPKTHSAVVNSLVAVVCHRTADDSVVSISASALFVNQRVAQFRYPISTRGNETVLEQIARDKTETPFSRLVRSCERDPRQVARRDWAGYRAPSQRRCAAPARDRGQSSRRSCHLVAIGDASEPAANSPPRSSRPSAVRADCRLGPPRSGTGWLCPNRPPQVSSLITHRTSIVTASVSAIP